MKKMMGNVFVIEMKWIKCSWNKLTIKINLSENLTGKFTNKYLKKKKNKKY